LLNTENGQDAHQATAVKKYSDLKANKRKQFKVKCNYELDKVGNFSLELESESEESCWPFVSNK